MARTDTHMTCEGKGREVWWRRGGVRSIVMSSAQRLTDEMDIQTDRQTDRQTDTQTCGPPPPLALSCSWEMVLASLPILIDREHCIASSSPLHARMCRTHSVHRAWQPVWVSHQSINRSIDGSKKNGSQLVSVYSPHSLYPPASQPARQPPRQTAICMHNMTNGNPTAVHHPVLI